MRGVAHDALRLCGAGGRIRKERLRDGIAEMRRLICTRSRAGRIDASAKGKNPPAENKKPARKKAAKPPRGAKMREQCDSSVGTRSTANVLHFRDAKRSRRRGCKMPVKRRASATVALRRRCGAGGRIRTADLFITSESLCLLSHTSLLRFAIIQRILHILSVSSLGEDLSPAVMDIKRMLSSLFKVAGAGCEKNFCEF